MNEARAIARKILTSKGPGRGVWIFRLRQAVQGYRFPASAIRSCHRVLWRWRLLRSPDRRRLEPTDLGRAVHYEIEQLQLRIAEGS